MRFFRDIIDSIANIKSYKDFAKRSFGNAIVYLLLITVILGTIWLLKPMYQTYKSFESFTNDFEKTAPEFKLENGNLEVFAQMPYIIEKDDESLFIIDTSGKTNESILQNYTNGILFTNNKIYYKNNSIEKREYDLSQFNGITINKEIFLKWLEYSKWFLAIMLVFGLIYFFITKLFIALIWGVAGKIIFKIKKISLPYSSAFKMCIHALTVPIIIQILKGWFLPNIGYFWIIYSGIIIFYLWQGSLYIENNDLKECNLMFDTDTDNNTIITENNDNE